MERINNHSNLNILCISASNRIDVKGTNSYRKCEIIISEVEKYTKNSHIEIVELQNYNMNPCMACSKCSNHKRCVRDEAFNKIYEKIIQCNILFIVSPHYSPIPSKLCMLLEKMGQIAYDKDKSYKSKTYGIKTAIITHGATAKDEISRKKKKMLLNDPIASALSDTQMKLIPLNDEWNTGICVQPIEKNNDGETILKIREYVDKVIQSYYE
jgi:multimeric flavodoxin WrbA